MGIKDIFSLKCPNYTSPNTIVDDNATPIEPSF